MVATAYAIARTVMKIRHTFDPGSPGGIVTPQLAQIHLFALSGVYEGYWCL
jgi:hypothetical protein